MLKRLWCSSQIFLKANKKIQLTTLFWLMGLAQVQRRLQPTLCIVMQGNLKVSTSGNRGIIKQ